MAIEIGGFVFIWDIMKIATPSWGGDFLFMPLNLVDWGAFLCGCATLLGSWGARGRILGK